MLELNDLLRKVDIEPESTMVMRHQPTEKSLKEALPTLVEEKPHLFTAFQRQHGPNVEVALSRASHLASFIADGAGRALFCGLYEVKGHKQLTPKQYWAVPEFKELGELGTRGPRPGQKPLVIDLERLDTLLDLKGRLVVNWPGIERAWWRWAGRNVFQIRTIHEENRLTPPMVAWSELVFSWDRLKTVPRSWRETLTQWRGIYYIHDAKSKLGYVGSAYGADNLWGRWSVYAANGHGGNRLLRGRDPKHFSFSILQLLNPDMPAEDVIRIESNWKMRLHTRHPEGLNDN